MDDRFVVTIVDTQNATWQGQLKDTKHENGIPFRSGLEMLKLMKEEINDEDKPENR